MTIVNNIKKNTILLVIITMIVLYFVLKDDAQGIIDTIKNMDVKYILLAFCCYLTSVTLKGYINYKIVNDKEKFSKTEAIRQNFIAQFFNGITPFQTGGEPMAIYMLREQGIPVSKATNYMVQSFIFYQIALVICGIIAVGYNSIFHIFPKVELLQKLVLLGFAINTIVVILLLASYSKQATTKLSKVTYKFVKKIKKNLTEEEWLQKFEDYHNGFQELKQRKKLFVGGISLNMISLICLYIVPFFVLKGLQNTETLTIMETLVSSAYVYLIGAFVPIPGASGGIEYGFTQFFGNFLEGSIVSAMVIVWRFLTYYLGIMIGAILFNIRERVRK
ncbi:MAG: flippase-like domain-containing protein [Bacilli bacterium]|nr:flippase-like domain-containing protein [Bacilli bacterium]